MIVEDRYVDVRGGRIFARSWDPSSVQADSGEPLLLFHDSIGAVALWRDFPGQLALATGRQVIAYDRLGFGQSSPRTDKMVASFVAEEAKSVVPALLLSFGIESFVPCGHSVGGGMAIETVARAPVRCPALITIAAQAFVEDRTLAGIREAKAAFADPANLQRLAKYHGDKARWVVDAWTETWLSREFADWSIDGVIESVTCPKLAIHGENDEYGTAVHPRRIASGPRDSILLMPETGHVPHRERPGEVVDAIKAFLARVSG